MVLMGWSEVHILRNAGLRVRAGYGSDFFLTRWVTFLVLNFLNSKMGLTISLHRSLNGLD